jgi:two-component system phosphate regulon response regulator PhoB
MTERSTVPPPAETVLIVDDEPDLCGLLEFNLQQAGFQTECVTRGLDALPAAARLRPAVVVLDLMLPDFPGTEICRRMRADSTYGDPAILMLTARGDEADRLAGLELGADDYVIKPFSVKELVMRVKALSRRTGERRRASVASDEGRRLRWRGLEVDPIRHRVLVDGEELTLRPMEYRLLAMLLEHPGEVLSRDRLLEDVWGVEESEEVNKRTVDTHVRRLRQRLGSAGDAIETVHGFGYRLREP